MATPDQQAKGKLLRVAAMDGDLAAVSALLAEGVAVDARAETGWTALIQALRNDHVAVARTLLEHGASPNVRYPMDGAPLFEHAASLEMWKLLWSHGAEPAPIFPREWLMHSVAWSEAQARVSAGRGADDGRVEDPLLNRVSWDEFKRYAREGDELWQFVNECLPMSGLGGYVIVRGGEPVKMYVTWKS